MINGIFLKPQTETILTNEVVQNIDKAYFISGILEDLGTYQIDTPSLNIETSNSKINTGSKEIEKPTRRRRQKNTKALQEASIESKEVASSKNETINPTKEEASIEEFSIKSSLQSSSLNMLADSGITEEQLLTYLAGYYKKPPTGISINDLDEDVKSLLERARRALLSGHVSFDDLSDELKNIIKSSSPADLDGDGNLDNSLGSGGTADIIGSQILIPIKESMLDKNIRASLEKAKTAYQKPEEGIPFSDLSVEIKEKIDSIDESNHFWKEPVESIGFLPFINNKNGDTILVMDTNKIYRWDEQLLNWIEIVSGSSSSADTEVPTNNPLNTSSILGEFFAYKNQKTFKLHSPFNPGTNQLLVTLNGVLVFNELDYTEVSNRIIEFHEPLEEDDYVVFALSSINPSSVIVTQMVEIEARVKEIRLQHSYMPGSDSLRVYLNGIQLQEGINADYIEVDTRTVSFNVDLLPSDMLAFRVETTTISKNIINQFALLRTIYSDLAKKVDKIQNQIPQT